MNTLELLKREFSPEDLETYIGTPLFLCLLFYPIFACILVLSAYSRIDLLLLHRYGFQQRQEEEVGRPLGQAKGGCYWGEPFNAPNPFILACACFQPTNPAPVTVELRGGVTVESDDEYTCVGLVFKRPRVGVTVAPSASASVGTPTFIDHPPSTSSPLQVVALEGGGENAPGG